MFLLGGYTLTESDRTYETNGGNIDALECASSVQRVTETYVAGVFDLNTDEAAKFGARELQIRRISRAGEKPVLEILTSVPKDELLRDYSTLTIPLLVERLNELKLDTTSGTKSDYIGRLDVAANEAHLTEEWVSASTDLGKALPEGRRFDATSAVDADIAIKDTLTTKYRMHLESDTLKERVREIESELEELLIEDAKNIREHITAKVSDIGDVQIKPTVSFTSANGLKSTDITVSNQADETINLKLSGAGRARRIALAIWEYNASLLAQSGEDIVLLYDEPDTHLDYGHQRELMTLIHKQTENAKITVVIASHSMNLIDGTDIGDVVHVKHEEHRTVIERLVDDSEVGSHLGAIAASVGLRNTVLLHERLFVGVEGESEARALPVLFKLATGRHLESCGIAVWPCGNNEGARHFAEFLHKKGRSVVFLVDEDSKRNSKHVFSPSKLKAAGLNPDTQCLYLGDPDEIEDIFTDEQWANVANQSWPRVSDKDLKWSSPDFSQHRSDKFSKLVLEMIRTDASAAPSGKPDMLIALALSLQSAEDVPTDLREKFDMLVKLAT